LTEKEIGESGHKGNAVWLASGLKIQEMQYGFGSFISKASDFLTPINTQVISSSPGEEDWVPSNT